MQGPSRGGLCGEAVAWEVCDLVEDVFVAEDPAIVEADKLVSDRAAHVFDMNAVERYDGANVQGASVPELDRVAYVQVVDRYADRADVGCRAVSVFGDWVSGGCCVVNVGRGCCVVNVGHVDHYTGLAKDVNL